MEIVTSSPKSKQIRQKYDFTLFKRFAKNKVAILGLIIIFTQIFFAIFAPLLTTHNPQLGILAHANLPIGSPGYLLGTDALGRDLFTRVLFGARISLVVGSSAVTLGLFGGILLGVLAGYYKKFDAPIMRFVDLLFSFPGVLLAMLIVAVLGTSLMNVIIAISVWSVPACARIVRGSVLEIKNREYILAMKSIGANDARIIFKHILPNCMSSIIVFATMRMATAILSAASLSFLGLGAQPPTPEWGAMVASGRELMWTSPHVMVIPGIAIMLVVFAFNVVGDALRDALDPNMNLD
ncbi:MAG: ABC transporter permease [Streptococcaceae bacterium]|jgi:peptide/nickel transport system permease protein|nr:ABC transporter permease [Streptococcaceae bacterium]